MPICQEGSPCAYKSRRVLGLDPFHAALFFISLSAFSAEEGFWAPPHPPTTRYEIEARLNPAEDRLIGAETITIANDAPRALRWFALNWEPAVDRPLSIKVGNHALPVENKRSPVLFELPKPLDPGSTVEISVEFETPFRPESGVLEAWHPQVSWGFPTHASYDVKLAAPADYAVGTTGRLDPKTGSYHADRVRSFGIFLGKGFQVKEAEADGISVRVLYRAAGAECAALLLETAADAVRFYRDRFGFYPQESLTIIPGAREPMGGYPVATGIVAIHGEEQFSKVPAAHWRWITAHEIAHQYWSEHVLSRSAQNLDWLLVGLGIYADREYCLARDIRDRHQKFFAEYAEGVRRGLDTTEERTPEQIEALDWDYNNIVEHGKGFGTVSALAATLGHETFDRIYRRCLKEFAGRRMGVGQFEAVAEAESGQDLQWFFDDWANSSRYVAYRITEQSSSTVRVVNDGTLRMPLPVEGLSRSGSREIAYTNRLLDDQDVRFVGATPLKEARLDPAAEIAMVVPPPLTTPSELRRLIQETPWTGADETARRRYQQARAISFTGGNGWRKLGMLLYDGGHYPEALEAFSRAERDSMDKAGIFAARVWKGHVLDLLGRRAEAVESYRESLESPPDVRMRNDQYGLVLDHEWVKERLKTPFVRAR